MPKRRSIKKTASCRTKKLKRDYRAWRIVLSVFLLVGLVSLASVGKDVWAQVWSEPTTTPPGNNAPAPIWNQNAAAQTGNFWISGNGLIGGDVGIGASPPLAALYVADQRNSIVRFEEYNDGDGVNLRSYRARGTMASPSAVLANDRLAVLTGAGRGASAWMSPNGGIGIYAAENYTATAAGTYITLSTSDLGTNPGGGGTERMRINSAGNVGIGTTPSAFRLAVADASNGTYSSGGLYAGYFDGNLEVHAGNITQGGVKVCLADGTNCPSAGGGGSSGRLYLTRTFSVAYNATTAQKDSQCQAEFGTNSINASAWDVIANFGATEAVNSSGLSGLVSDGSYLVYSLTTWGTVAPTDLRVTSITMNTSRVWCVPKTNNLIFTRTKIAYNSSVAAKDSQCSSEWGGGKVWGVGGSYRAGSLGDILAAWGGATGYSLTVLAYTSANNSYLSVQNTPSQIAESTISSGTGVVGCIRYPAQ